MQRLAAELTHTAWRQPFRFCVHSLLLLVAHCDAIGLPRARYIFFTYR